MADEPKKEEAGVTAGGVRMADRRFRFEKHGTKPGKKGAPKQPFTRPWGSQPMGVKLKTGELIGQPHPEPKLIFKESQAAAEAAKVPTMDVEVKQVFGR